MKKESKVDLSPGFTGRSVDAVPTDCVNIEEVKKVSVFVA